MKDKNPDLTFDERAMRKMNRRELLKLTPLVALGAVALPKYSEPLIQKGLALSDEVSEKMFRRQSLARTFSDSQVTPPAKFPVNAYGVIPEVDATKWSLTVEGLVERPGEYSLAQIQGLPKHSQNVEHICIEGWSVIGNFAGARISDFLKLIGADPSARFVEVACLDDYYSSYEIASCLHPQSLLCYEMYGRPLAPSHGAPLRIHMPTKLGYKSSKHLYSLRVSNVLGKEKGFWEDQGYSWHGGI